MTGGLGSAPRPARYFARGASLLIPSETRPRLPSGLSAFRRTRHTLGLNSVNRIGRSATARWLTISKIWPTQSMTLQLDTTILRSDPARRGCCHGNERMGAVPNGGNMNTMEQTQWTATQPKTRFSLW
jgi:hypothetical protein